ncbi:hypothetical protein L6452_14207 [Arctium lappa]|uniref:Uncharacterized protein n=1 Tax=Arctium lappa TaxID=4217 RepID=A0ACB9CKE5_ARCLA|nr:hypothetical protein L6452_14207 [Arctium lappa]
MESSKTSMESNFFNLNHGRKEEEGMMVRRKKGRRWLERKGRSTGHLQVSMEKKQKALLSSMGENEDDLEDSF